MSNFDLSSFDALMKAQEDGVPLSIKHPGTGDPIGLTLIVAGEDSEIARKVNRRQLNARLKEQRKKLSAEDVERNQREAVVAMVLGWRWEGLTLDNGTPDFSTDGVESLFKRFPFIMEQVEAHVSDRANFLPA